MIFAVLIRQLDVSKSNDVSLYSLKGGKEFMMRAHFGLPSVESGELEAKRPITVKFEIPYFTVSGIQVRHTFTSQNIL